MKGNVSDPGEQLRALGWRQGSVIEGAELTRRGHGTWHCAVVVSQDCDVVHSVDDEPEVEVVLGTRQESPRPDMLNARNPRELDLPILVNKTAAHASFRIRDRILIEKRELVGLAPSQAIEVPRPSVGVLTRWITKRYSRAAFPDEFNSRLEKVDSRLERLFKSSDSVPITGIYLILPSGDRELPADEEYIVVVWLTVKVETLAAAAEYKKAQNFELRLREILAACKGIQATLELKSEADVSLDDLRIVKRFDRDYRSLASKPGGAMPPESV